MTNFGIETIRLGIARGYSIQSPLSGSNTMINLGLGLLSSTVLYGRGGFSPASLFAASEQGVWYDPSDFSTMFQDSAGTTPVTAVEQPVGLIQDKSGNGNHASQSTSASRPVLSARVNLLTQTENFSNAAWTKSNATVASSAVTAPDGVSTMTKLLPNSGTGTNRFISQSGIGNKMVVFAKADELTWLMLYSGIANSNAWFDLENGVEGSKNSDVVSASIDDVGNDIYRCTVVWTTLSSTPRIYATSANGSLSVTTTGTEGIYIWGADLRVTNDGVGLPAYQRVTTATDYDTTGFPYYLRADGTDDSLASSSIDFLSTDKIAVFAGIRKLSDTAQAMLVELSADVNSNSGSFFVTAPQNAATANYGFRSRGSAVPAAITASGYASPISSVVTGIADISGDIARLRVNGVQVASSTDDQGTGNFGNYSLYVGRRGGSTLPFNGNIYGLVIVGRALTAGEIDSMETWMNTKTRAY